MSTEDDPLNRLETELGHDAIDHLAAMGAELATLAQRNVQETEPAAIEQLFHDYLLKFEEFSAQPMMTPGAVAFAASRHTAILLTNLWQRAGADPEDLLRILSENPFSEE
ncbi:hypothetical protein K8P10_001825 [Leucobacter sp. Psy1]|uniref:hypothetical protein n=1 Tax=Leucobacter sp. Psy1 TaxID=2875729 RepID=UPI001CD48902|nr:hypothetical protein [Leucobacter sp. Psy1]UBH06314.1 hypothetical protein K8P10_001825 [Leucobacter sp. Psy1]